MQNNLSATNEYQAPHEPAMGEAQTVSLTSDIRQKLFAVFINVLVIGELSVSMYFAHQAAARFTPVFFKIFFCLLLPTLVFAYIGRRALAKARA
ncbi:hypothetical protein LJC22_05225 [Desulfosarcina sp. OttesenSCG-928-G10]|nr:hypothetical protein [Desulfosarcina sp. OttesenSCG-928-G10]